jgi:hypothetical protein
MKNLFIAFATSALCMFLVLEGIEAGTTFSLVIYYFVAPIIFLLVGLYLKNKFYENTLDVSAKNASFANSYEREDQAE